MIDMSLTNIAVAVIPMPAPARSGRNDKNICSFKSIAFTSLILIPIARYIPNCSSLCFSVITQYSKNPTEHTISESIKLNVNIPFVICTVAEFLFSSISCCADVKFLYISSTVFPFDRFIHTLYGVMPNFSTTVA